MRVQAIVLSSLATLAVACSDDAPGVDANLPVDATGGIDAVSTCPTLGVTWQAVGAQPVIGNGVCPGWHCIGSGDPAIARTPDGRIAMWFTTVGIVDEGGTLVAKLDIGRATASDTEAPVMTVDPDHALLVSPTSASLWDRYAETVSVAYDDAAARWSMWYLGYAASPGFVGAGLGQMRSLDADGTIWERAPAPIYRPTPGGWDAALVTGPTALRGPDGIWRLYYSGASPTTGLTGVGLLTSTDGTTWTPSPQNPVFPAGGADAWDQAVLEQTVRYHAGRYWMLYSAYREPLDLDTTVISIGLATSTDGLTWQRHPDNPVLRPGAPGAWNDLRVLAPDLVVEPDGSFLLAAYGQAVGDPDSDQPGRAALWRSRCP